MVYFLQVYCTSLCNINGGVWHASITLSQPLMPPKSTTHPDLQRCLPVSAGQYRTGCQLFLPGHSLQAAHRAHQCLGRSHVPLTWGENIRLSWQENRRSCPSRQFHISMFFLQFGLTSPWLVLFPGFLCRPQPSLWKHEIKDRPFQSNVLLSLLWKRFQIQEPRSIFGSLTLCFFQSPSPAGSLVSFALPFWPETDCTITSDFSSFILKHCYMLHATLRYLLLMSHYNGPNTLLTQL